MNQLNQHKDTVKRASGVRNQSFLLCFLFWCVFVSLKKKKRKKEKKPKTFKWCPKTYLSIPQFLFDVSIDWLKPGPSP